MPVHERRTTHTDTHTRSRTHAAAPSVRRVHEFACLCVRAHDADVFACQVPKFLGTVCVCGGEGVPGQKYTLASLAGRV